MDYREHNEKIGHISASKFLSPQMVINLFSPWHHTIYSKESLNITSRNNTEADLE